MSASTEAILLYGIVSQDHDIWQSLEEEKGVLARKKGLVFGSLMDGETESYYLAVKNSITTIGAGMFTTPLTSSSLIPSHNWHDTLEEFATIHISPTGIDGPNWYMGCSTDRDY